MPGIGILLLTTLVPFCCNIARCASIGRAEGASKGKNGEGGQKIEPASGWLRAG